MTERTPEEKLLELRRALRDAWPLDRASPLAPRIVALYALIEGAREELPKLLDEIEASRALLKRIEWSGWNYSEQDGTTTGVCPECQTGRGAHRPGCELAALLGK